jgi:hypothetical protein
MWFGWQIVLSILDVAKAIADLLARASKLSPKHVVDCVDNGLPDFCESWEAKKYSTPYIATIAIVISQLTLDPFNVTAMDV